MSVTQTIISFASKKVLDKAIGGATAVFTAYHKTHFILLYRVIKEAERDGKIQDEVRKIQENLESFTAAGRAMLDAIPQKPEPPSADGALPFDKARIAAFAEEVKAFTAGVQNVIERLRGYVSAAREVEKKTEKELNALEKRLNRTDVKSGALRKTSNARRQQDIDLIRIVEMKKLSETRGWVESRLSAYLNF